MKNIMKTIGVLLTICLLTGLKTEAQWSRLDSDATCSLIGAYRLDSAPGYPERNSGTILDGDQPDGLEVVAVQSRKDGFAVDLPRIGNLGIECRSGGSMGGFTVTFIFNNPLASIDNVTASCGNVSSSVISPGDAHELRIRLTGVTCNTQYVTLTVIGAHDKQGNILSTVNTEFGLLLGDVNGDGVVNNADANQIKADRGQITDSSNFREDINTNGRIDAGDLAIVKAQRDTVLPPPANPAIFVADKDDNSVIRANLDGSDAIDLGNIGGLINNPDAIAVDSAAGKLYVVNGSGNSVVMSNLDGSDPVNLTFGGLLQVPDGIALDTAGGKIYVSVNLGSSPVIRANLDGSGAEGLGNFGGPFAGVELAGMDIDTVHGKIYVAANSGPEGQIARIVEADLADGSNAVALDFGGGLYAPLDVKVDPAGGNLYVVDFSSLIYRSDLSGNGVVGLGDVAGPFPCCLALDVVGGKMYISAFHTVTLADLPDGKNPVALNIPALGTPAGIAIYRP